MAWLLRYRSYAPAVEVWMDLTQVGTEAEEDADPVPVYEWSGDFRVVSDGTAQPGQFVVTYERQSGQTVTVSQSAVDAVAATAGTTDFSVPPSHANSVTSGLSIGQVF